MAGNEMSKAVQNALSVSYDVLGSHVELDLDFVKRYLVRGNPEKITDQEIVFFMNTCKMQKLNPLVSGEVYCITERRCPSAALTHEDGDGDRNSLIRLLRQARIPPRWKSSEFQDTCASRRRLRRQ